MATDIGARIDAFRAKKQQEEDEKKKLEQEQQRSVLKAVVERNLMTPTTQTTGAETKTETSSLPSARVTVTPLSETTLPSSLRKTIDETAKNLPKVSTQTTEEPKKQETLKQKIESASKDVSKAVSKTIVPNKQYAATDVPLVPSREKTDHNVGTYALQNFGAGFISGTRAGIDAAENIIADFATGGQRSAEIKKISDFFQENPSSYEALMRGEGVDKTIAIANIAKQAGVSAKSVEAFKTQNQSNYYKQDADKWAKEEDIGAVTKFIFGDAAYQVGMQAPGMMLGAALPTSSGTSLVETVRDSVSGKSGKALVDALGKGFIKGVGNAAKGNATTWLMAANSAGSKFFENQMTYGDEGSVARNLLDSAANGFFESFTEGIGGFSDVPTIGKFFDTRTGSKAGTILRSATKLLLGAAEEGLEEVLNVPLSGVADKLTVDPDKKWFGEGGIFDGKEMLVSGAQGALIGGLMGTVATSATVLDALGKANTTKTGDVTTIGLTAETMNPAEIKIATDLLNRESEKYGIEKLDAKKTTPEMLEDRAALLLDAARTAYNEDLLSRKNELIDSGLAAPVGSMTEAYARNLDARRDTVTAEELNRLIGFETARIKAVADSMPKQESPAPSQTKAQTEEAAVQEEIKSEQTQRRIVSEANDGATVATDLALRLKELAPKANLKTTQKLADVVRMVQQGQMPNKSYNEALNLLKSDKVRYAVESALNVDAENPIHIDAQNAKTIRTSLQQISDSYIHLANQAELDNLSDRIADVVATERDVNAPNADANAINTKANTITSDVNAPNADVNAINTEVNTITTELNADVVRAPSDSITVGDRKITRAEFVRNYGAELAKEGRAADDVFDNYIRAERDANAITSDVNASERDANAEANAINTEANTSERDVNATRLHRLYNTEKPLTEIQRTSIEALDRLASAINVDIYLYDSTETSAYGDSSGRYEVQSDRVYIDINAGSQYEGTILRTAGHELVHFIKRWSPDEFRKLSSFVEKTLVDSGADISSLVSDKITQAAEHGATRTKAVAYEEVIADSCVSVLTDTDALAELAQTDRGLFDRIMDFFRDFIDRIRSVYADYKPTTDAGRIMAEQTQDVLDRLSSAYSSALIAAGEARTEAQKLLSGEQSKLSEAKTEGGEVLLDYRAIKADLPKYREMLTAYGGMTSEQIDTLFETLDKTLDIVSKNLKALDYGYESDLSEQRPFNPVKPNSDKLYKLSIDFSTLCRKRILQGIVAEKLQEQLKRPLSKEEAIEVRNRLVEVQKEGRQIEVACALCYVEAARLKTPAQVQKFMDNRASIMYNYFAENDRVTKDAINAAERQKKTELGYEPTAAVKGKDKAAVRNAKAAARNTYQITDAQKAEIAYAESLPVNAFTTAEGLSDLAKAHPDVFAAYAAAVRAASHSKGLEADVPWRAGDSDVIGDRLISSMNVGAGLRSQSWSDFQIEHLLDEIAMTIEIASRGAKMHSYTKVPDYVRLLGQTGHMINMSLIPTQDGEGFDGVEGMPYEEMLALRDKYPNTAGNICIGVTDAQILRLLASDEIDYVIPYHKSGNSKATRKLLKIPSWSDYEGIQTEKGNGDKPVFAGWFDLAKAQETAARENAKPTDPAMAERYGVQYGAYKAMQEAADKYLALCAERGLTPKFKGKVEGRTVDFTTDPNYWKLLIDRKMINQITGEIIEQKPVQPIFDANEIYGADGTGGMLGRAVANYPNLVADRDYAVNAVTRDFLTDRGIAPDVVAERITEAAEELFEYRESALSEETDRRYLSAVESGDTETAQRMVDEAAAEAGYTIKAYHGTNAVFNVFDPGLLGAKNFAASSAYKGFFAAKSRETAENYTGLNSADTTLAMMNTESREAMEQIKAKYGYDSAKAEYEKAKEAFFDEYKAAHGYKEAVTDIVDSFKEFFPDANEAKLKDLARSFAYDWNTANSGDGRNNVNRMNAEFDETEAAKRFEEFNRRIFDEWEQTEIKRRGYVPNVKELYLKIDNPLVHDFKNEGRDVDFTDLIDEAKKNGHDGAIFQNVQDGADFDDIYVVFSNTQLKSSEPVAYDDNGKAIPLSQRFNAGNEDIRYEHRDISTTKSFQDFAKAYDAVYGEGAARTIVRTTEQFDRERARQRKRETTAAQMAKLPDTQKRIAAEMKRLEADRRQREKIEALQNPKTRKRKLTAQKNRAQMRELLAAAKMNADARVADQAYRDNYEMQLRLAEAKQRAEERLKRVTTNLRVNYEEQLQRTKARFDDERLREKQKQFDAKQRSAEQQERKKYQSDMAKLLKRRDEQIMRDNAEVRAAQKNYARDIRQDPEALRNRNNEAVLQKAAEQDAQYPTVYAARQNAAAQRTGVEVISQTDATQKAPVLEGQPGRPISVSDIEKKGSVYGKSAKETLSEIPGKAADRARTVYRMMVNAAQGIDNVAQKQRKEGFNVTASDLMTSVRNSKDTAAYILTDALVGRGGEVLGKALSDVILVKKRGGKVDQDLQRVYDAYLKLMHTVDRMSIEANAFAELQDFLDKHEWLRGLFPSDAPQPIDTRGGTFIEKMLGRTEEEITEAHTAANLYNQFVNAKNKPVYGTVEYVDGKGQKQVREIDVMTAQEAQVLIDQYNAEQPWLKQKAEEYYEWWDTFMREWAVGTSITAEDYEAMHRMYPHYVPTYREGKNAGAAASARGGKVSTSEAVKRAKGGVSEVRWVQDTLAEQVGRLVTLRRTNDLLLNLVDTGLLDGSDTLGTGIRIRPESLGYGALMNAEELGDDNVIARAISNEGGKYSISAWDNGERVTADIDEGLYKALQSLFPQEDTLGKLTSFGRKLTAPMKGFLTGYNPFFVARNVARDFGTALIQTEGSMAEYAAHYARAYKYIMSGDSRWKEYKALGNTGSQRYRDDVGLAKFDKIMTPNAFTYVKNALGIIGETTEAAARFAEYLLVAEKEGFTREAKLHASKAAAEITTDFSRSGDFGRFINAWIPYTNAATQGVDRVLRDLTLGKKALNRLGRAAVVQAVPAAIAAVIIKGLGREEEYEQISDYQKDNYFLFPVAEGKWIRIPKTETYGKILASGVSRAFEAAWGREDPFKDYSDIVGESLNLSWVGSDSAVEGLLEALNIRDIAVVGSLVDLLLNKDFSGRDIVGSEFKDFTSGEFAPKSEQYNNDTSLLAYGLSKAIANAFSPVEVDYLLRDYMGDFYHTLVSTANVGILQAFSAEDLMQDLGEAFVSEASGSFIVDPVYSNRYTSEYYDALDSLGSTIAGERARIEDPEARKTTVAYRTRQAVNYAYGDLISDAYKRAREATSEADKHDARAEAAALSIEALDFIERALAGEYGSNPYDYVKYIDYGDGVAKALLALDSFKDEYAFEPNASYAPSSLKVGSKKRDLTESERDAYKALYAEVYAELAQEAINSKKYKNATDKKRAEILEDVASKAREETTDRFRDQLK
ncbi:MAG: hypothetical protein J6S14_11610 [Clostridia bacterium]|nr:hypothetical protein [Clostridia bacterium]